MSAALGDPAGHAAGPPPIVATARVRPVLLAFLVTVPWLVAMLVWAGSNPPGAAPDENGQLVKALAMARLDIGRLYVPDAKHQPTSAAQQRNDSISRVVAVPRQLQVPDPGCVAARPTVAANCLNFRAHPTGGTVPMVTTVGSYPPFLYVLPGLAAIQMNTVYRAYLAARIVGVLWSWLLLLFGTAHLLRWLGSTTLLALPVALTPSALFAAASVGTSGAEIFGAFTLACVVAVAVLRRESLLRPGTYVLLSVAAAMLTLSRQLGVVTLTALLAVLLVRPGVPFLLRAWRARPVAFTFAVIVILGSVAALGSWELAYDHPAIIGPLFTQRAAGGFFSEAYGVFQSGVDRFGWLDTSGPAWVVGVWSAVAVMVVGLALLATTVWVRVLLLGWGAALIAVAYATYATVFNPVGAAIQGRHLLPFFMFIPVMAAAALSYYSTCSAQSQSGQVGDGRGSSHEPLSGLLQILIIRLGKLAMIMAAVVSFASLVANARRYAVGTNGPIWFLGKPAWSPGLGWPVWLIAAFGASVLIAASAAAFRPTGQLGRLGSSRFPDTADRS